MFLRDAAAGLTLSVLRCIIIIVRSIFNNFIMSISTPEGKREEFNEVLKSAGWLRGWFHPVPTHEKMGMVPNLDMNNGAGGRFLDNSISWAERPAGQGDERTETSIEDRARKVAAKYNMVFYPSLKAFIESQQGAMSSPDNMVDIGDLEALYEPGYITVGHYLKNPGDYLVSTNAIFFLSGSVDGKMVVKRLDVPRNAMVLGSDGKVLDGLVDFMMVLDELGFNFAGSDTWAVQNLTGELTRRKSGSSDSGRSPAPEPLEL